MRTSRLHACRPDVIREEIESFRIEARTSIMPSPPMSAGRDATRDTLNRILGEKYEVAQWIGGGGMADVFLGAAPGAWGAVRDQSAFRFPAIPRS